MPRQARARPAAPHGARVRAVPDPTSGATKQHAVRRERPAIASTHRRCRRRERVGPGGHSGRSARPSVAAPARRAGGSARSRRWSRPPTESRCVPAGRRAPTARRRAASRSRSARRARARRRPALPAPIRTVARAIDSQLADAALDELALRRAGAQDDGAAARSATAASAAAGRPRPATRLRPRGRRRRRPSCPPTSRRSVGAGHAGREPLDRRGLRDVERLAGGDAAASSTSVIERTTSRRASTCATAPPSSPAPMMATSRIGWIIVMAMQSTSRARSRSSPAARAASASRSRARWSPRACRSRVTGRSEAHLSAARAAHRGGGPGCGRDAAGRRAPLRRGAARVDATVARFGGLDILINNAGIGIFTDVADDDARAVGRGHRHEPDRRLQRLPRGAAAPARSAAAASSSTSAAWRARTRSRTARPTARRRPG